MEDNEKPVVVVVVENSLPIYTYTETTLGLNYVFHLFKGNYNIQRINLCISTQDLHTE